VLLQAHTADVVNIVAGDVYRRVSLYAPTMVNEAVLRGGFCAIFPHCMPGTDRLCAEVAIWIVIHKNTHSVKNIKDLLSRFAFNSGGWLLAKPCSTRA
jgi:hypothetical protein